MSLALLIAYVLITAVGCALEYLNAAHFNLRRFTLPEELDKESDADQIARAQAYCTDNAWFVSVASLYNASVFLVFLYSGPLVRFDRWIASFGLGFVASGVLFFVLLFLAGSVLNLPLDFYRRFVIERRHGFNAATPALWALDRVKGAALTVFFTALAAGASLWIYMASPGLWWAWLWLFYLGLSVLLIYISPYLIEPLFNRFEPLEDPALEESIRGVTERAAIRVSRVFKMDASRRTSHTNAYFTGIGRVKRIVLYDTLLARLAPDEILAVLSHEIGHWKRHHLLKGILMTEAVALVSLYLAHLFLSHDLPNRLLGIDGSLLTGVVILGFLASIAGFVLAPFFAAISRRHEREADGYSFELTGTAGPMISALVKLSMDNLSNLNPHPLYVIVHYSHPSAAERIRYLKGLRRG